MQLALSELEFGPSGRAGSLMDLINLNDCGHPSGQLSHSLHAYAHTLLSVCNLPPGPFCRHLDTCLTSLISLPSDLAGMMALRVTRFSMRRAPTTFDL